MQHSSTTSVSGPYYVVIVDAGSTGTRPYIYRIWPTVCSGDRHQQAKVTEVFHENGTELGKIDRGIDQFMRRDGTVNEDMLRKRLQPLFDDVQATIPLGGIKANVVKFYMLATAGVRQLSQERQEALHKSLKDYALTFGFKEAESRTITGTEEAKFGWVAAHYARGESTPYKNVYVEVGGASAQVVMPLVNPRMVDEANTVASRFSEENSLNTAKVVNLGGDPEKLFLASYHLGTNDGYKAYREALFCSPQNPPEMMIPVFPDPTKHENYYSREDRGAIQGMAGATKDDRAHKAETLIESAMKTLCPGQDEKLLFAPRPVGLPAFKVIGAATFWWAMQDSKGNDASKFKFKEWLLRVAKFEGDTTNDPDGKSFFAAIWIHQVLRTFFEVTDFDTYLTFTPYNGPNGVRLSWTLGSAVLLATPTLEHICNDKVASFST